MSKASSRPRLGRGLSSLISISEPAEAARPVAERSVPSPAGGTSVAPPPPADAALPATARVLDVPLDRIAANPHQPRRQFEDAAIAELAASLKANGVIQPVIVRQVAGGYQLIAGERRLRAARLAGLATIPAVLKEVDSFTQAQMALVENIQREDLNPLDRAVGYRTLIDQLGLTQSELAQRLGEDRSQIANHLRLLDLAEPVQELVRRGQLSLGHAKVLAGVADPLEQQRLAELVKGQDLSVRNLERLVASPTATPAPARTAAAATPAHLKSLETAISRQLSLRCQVRATSKKKGRLVIHYASLDQFDELMKRLGVDLDE
jgi:ParB family chromosome partitioning protein